MYFYTDQEWRVGQGLMPLVEKITLASPAGYAWEAVTIMDRPHLRYRVGYLKGSAVVDYYDTEDPNVTQAVIGAETFFDRAKEEHGAESFRILDRVSGHYFEGLRLGLLEFAIGDIREAVWSRNIMIRQLRKRVAAILQRLD